MYHQIILFEKWFAFSFSRGFSSVPPWLTVLTECPWVGIDHAQSSSLPDVLFAFWRLFSTTFASIQDLKDKLPGGVLRISGDGDDRRIFLGLKFLIPGFFWVGKFGKYFFRCLDLSGDFFGYSKQSEDLW